MPEPLPGCCGLLLKNDLLKDSLQKVRKKLGFVSTNDVMRCNYDVAVTAPGRVALEPVSVIVS